MKNLSENEFYGFWSYALNVSKVALCDGDFHTGSSGFYIERDPSVVYLFQNFLTGSKILVANDDHLKKIKTKLSCTEISTANILELKSFQDYHLEFDDFDFFLEEKPSLKVESSGISEISKNDQKQIDKFYKQLSEDDIDTLDLDFDDDTTKAWAIKDKENSILAIGRYYLIPTENGTMDITLATSKNHRAKGFASKRLSKIVVTGLSNQNIPRYRVKTDNLASIKVAEKLGFKKFSRIQAICKR